MSSSTCTAWLPEKFDGVVMSSFVATWICLLFLKSPLRAQLFSTNFGLGHTSKKQKHTMLLLVLLLLQPLQFLSFWVSSRSLFFVAIRKNIYFSTKGVPCHFTESPFDDCQLANWQLLSTQLFDRLLANWQLVDRQLVDTDNCQIIIYSTTWCLWRPFPQPFKGYTYFAQGMKNMDQDNPIKLGWV